MQGQYRGSSLMYLTLIGQVLANTSSQPKMCSAAQALADQLETKHGLGAFICEALTQGGVGKPACLGGGRSPPFPSGVAYLPRPVPACTWFHPVELCRLLSR